MRPTTLQTLALTVLAIILVVLAVYALSPTNVGSTCRSGLIEGRDLVARWDPLPC